MSILRGPFITYFYFWMNYAISPQIKLWSFDFVYHSSFKLIAKNPLKAAYLGDSEEK